MKANEQVVRYKRSRFSTRLPVDRLYTRSHYWLRQDEAGLWQVGLTKFATRMLGDIVEYEFAVAEGEVVRVGREIGWIEGFKAMSDIYAVADGTFAGGNPALADDITLLESSPYGAGWLYVVDGEPEPDAVGVQEYVHGLDATIDRMLADRGEGDSSNG